MANIYTNRINKAKANLSEKKQEYAKRFGSYLSAVDKTRADIKLAKEKGWKHLEAEGVKKLNDLLAGKDFTQDEKWTKAQMERQISAAEEEVKDAEEQAKQYTEEAALGEQYFWHCAYEAMQQGKKIFFNK